MARTKRNIPYRKYWAMTKDEAKSWCEEFRNSRYFEYYYRAYLLHGTDAGNHTCNSGQYFNKAHRVGRRIEREQLRPHIIIDTEFDDSRYREIYKGIWWDLF